MCERAVCALAFGIGQVRAALNRIRHGVVHVAFVSWAEATVAAKAERAASAWAQREADSGQSAEFAESASVLLQTTQSLGEAVSELRAAGESRSEEATRASEATERRLATIETQLARTSALLQRTEKLLAPLPAAAVDQAAYTMMREEVRGAEVQPSRPQPEAPLPASRRSARAPTPSRVCARPAGSSSGGGRISRGAPSPRHPQVLRLGAALASTQRQMATMHSSKAGRHELAGLQAGIRSMLLGSSALKAASSRGDGGPLLFAVPDAPPTTSFFAPDPLAVPSQPPLEATTEAQPVAAAAGVQVAGQRPRPPSARRERAAGRPVRATPARPTSAAPTLTAPSAATAATSPRVLSDVEPMAAAAAAAAATRRPVSARAPGAAYPSGRTAAQAEASARGDYVVQVTELTQLFEERGASARRTAGGRGSVTRRPPSASPRAAGQTARGALPSV